MKCESYANASQISITIVNGKSPQEPSERSNYFNRLRNRMMRINILLTKTRLALSFAALS